MLTSKFLTASLTALAVVGTAGLVYAQSSSGTAMPDSTVQAQPAMTPPGSGGMAVPATGSTATTPMNQDTSTMDQPIARADRN